jgi:hypothetical protein
MLQLRESITGTYIGSVLPSQRRQAVLRRLTTHGEVYFSELATDQA